MATTIKISDELYIDAKKYAAVYHRSIPKQVEYWSKIGKIATDNPDLPVPFIQDILVALEDVECGDVSEFRFGETD